MAQGGSTPTGERDPRRSPLSKLTTNQQVVMEYLQRYIEEHRRGPLIREIQAACGIVSYKSVLDRLTALERKGLIHRRLNKHRGIRIVRRLEPSPSVALSASVATP